MILIWGVPGDAPLDAVKSALERAGANVRLLDQRLAAKMKINLLVEPDGHVSGQLSAPQGEIALGDIGAAYIRPLDTVRACGTEAINDPTFVRALEADSALIAWADLSRAHVVNRPAAMAANNSKPYQLGLIAGFGFAVPDTLVTTDETAARWFHQRHGDVIYKSVSGVRSIVSCLGKAECQFRDIANCPTQFQEYIPGVDVRVHVAGEKTIATQVTSPADDYRYASRSGASLAMVPLDLPADIADACRAMVRGMGLYLAGIDLRHTPDNLWYCLEVNPSPGFTFFEGITGQPIATAAAELLMRLDRSASLSS
jgi:glutathione synthase/RimK-type ligase-like ATP-grasp enzyme